MKIKVFVLTHMYRTTNENETGLEVVAVLSTMAKAKELFAEEKEKVAAEYEEEFPDDWEVYDNFPTLYGVNCKSEEIWDELLITEKEVDNKE